MDNPPLTAITPRQKVVVPEESCKVFLSCFSESFSASDLNLCNPIDGVYYIDEVFNEEECEKIQYEIDNNEFLSFWCIDKENDPEVQSFRNAYTIEMQSPEFGDKLWSRVATLLDGNFHVNIADDEDDENYERDLVGEWIPYTLNPHSLFAKYPSLGSFAPHTDGRAIIDFNKRSHYSVVLYFNNVPKELGAGTRFYQNAAIQQLKKVNKFGNDYWTADPSLITFEVEAKAGRMVIFHQSLVHEGVPPLAEHQKYILRSDVIFQRTPPICDNADDREAYKLFREAENLAESGEVEKSLVLFRKAFKLSPLLSRIMGQS
jgi:hypothetical protein